ncbi:conserved Plasmodium protein, unknown function [Plasmodium berghei]|uniref:Uncharacterized protein n=2 Tax=Plasmodium berghei TaxID=5821 RepID=A0A509AIQ1_PLABA|nr:conserved Plasmodium protein, unknown function [Plasmodium berghei ANKA]CXI13245.1 conserved Plasmodium protein, unknown function [Plasmodium berghei]SCL93477.1 conserved Plasmodium protein, unknown function [Plasmodium berghei]SCM15871.1 conserved Plasmodium protein, unknown function [Plasmodium berghei]SCM17667.1 conserved Plasmodium protein, unknown function [Plasmodium berghei]SCN23214.1 conserved Plasmodium protein, unknown function [Plasmodium berghei]|eukprot:XP_034420475.1 conserved Plasmodium protein, unknown function [Plasmodium berghei ANKA]
MEGNIQTRMQTKILTKLYMKNDVTNKENTRLRNKTNNRKIESKNMRVNKRTVKSYLKSCDRKRGKEKLYVKKIENSKKKNKPSFSSKMDILKEDKSKRKNNNLVNNTVVNNNAVNKNNYNDFKNKMNTCIYFHNNYNNDKAGKNENNTYDSKNEKKKKNSNDTKKDKNYIYNYLQDNGIEIKNDKYIFKYKNTLNKIQTFIFPIYKYGDHLIARNKAIFLKIHIHTCLFCQNGILCNFVENYMI